MNLNLIAISYFNIEDFDTFKIVFWVNIHSKLILSS